MRTVAIDWSGNASNSGKTIWVAEVANGDLKFLANGRRGPEVARLLVEWADDDSDLVVGLDFAFSFPAWYLREAGFKSAYELWARAAADGEGWLAACAPPFWGRPGTKRPDLGDRAHYRQTELDSPSTAGTRPKSVFQIGGAGAVGTGSIRGMAILATLHEAGFSIWPFDPPGWPRIVEIYPRLLTGPVRKSSGPNRQAYLSARGLGGTPALTSLAASTEDAFDATVSALVMWEHAPELGELPELSDDGSRLEGVIWYPREATVLPGGRPDLARALTRALEWFGEQHRKGKPAVLYIGHLLGVAAIVIEAGGDSTIVVAALLQDSLEDQPELVTHRLLQAEFGAAVARIVRECSDSDPAASDEPRDEVNWLERKNLYVQHLNKASLDALKVSLADKLYNARAIRMDQAVRGDAFWEPFNAKLEAQLTYYRGLVRAFESREDLDGPWRHMVKELGETVEAIASKS